MKTTIKSQYFDHPEGYYGFLMCLY